MRKDRLDLIKLLLYDGYDVYDVTRAARPVPIHHVHGDQHHPAGTWIVAQKEHVPFQVFAPF